MIRQEAGRRGVVRRDSKLMRHQPPRSGGGQARAVVAGGVVDLGALGHDAGRIDGSVAAVIVLLDVVHVDGLGDARAREVSRHALARGFDRGFSQSERMMLCLPLEHSEDPADQERCVGLMASLDEDPAWLDYSRRHRDVIARFGRFPGRNAALGRETTAEEAAFLAEPGASFEGPPDRR